MDQETRTVTTPNGNYRRRNYRCPRCNRKWFRAYLPPEVFMHIRCPKCKLTVFIRYDTRGLFIEEDETVEEPAAKSPCPTCAEAQMTGAVDAKLDTAQT
jgi:phage FluMu protein Com